MSANERRVGKFRISGHVLTERPIWLCEIMRRCIILRAGHGFGDEIEYVAESESFDPLPESGVIPEYTWEAIEHPVENNYDEDVVEIEVKAVRLKKCPCCGRDNP
jgi:hypothetical protein